jgi:uracil-DNA glycosylase
MGLCFSIPRTTKTPPSLTNIYKALVKDPKVNFTMPTPVHGDLSSWANQGVLMINATMTVRTGASNSHKSCGWLLFTQAVIDLINKEKTGVSFLIWGKYADGVCKNLNITKHHYLYFGHPSPLGMGGKFEDCDHFSKTNENLKKQGLKEIDWQV